jgi:hypothetical protein
MPFINIPYGTPDGIYKHFRDVNGTELHVVLSRPSVQSIEPIMHSNSTSTGGEVTIRSGCNSAIMCTQDFNLVNAGLSQYCGSSDFKAERIITCLRDLRFTTFALTRRMEVYTLPAMFLSLQTKSASYAGQIAQVIASLARGSSTDTITQARLSVSLSIAPTKREQGRLNGRKCSSCSRA